MPASSCGAGWFAILLALAPGSAIAAPTDSAVPADLSLTASPATQPALPYAPSGGADTSQPRTATSDLSPSDVTRIDALRMRDDLIRPSVTNTVLQNIGGWRSTLADYGIGVTGYLVGAFAVNLLHEPQTTGGVRRYVGQSPEFDSDTNYISLNYDLGRIGLKDGLFTVRGCLAASTAGTYAHGMRLCSAYVDQPLLNDHVEIQLGILTNHFQYVNPLVGGSDSTGSLGPDANLFTELGEGTGGAGAPGVNVRINAGYFYNKAGIQRAASPVGTIYEEQVADPYGTRFNGIGSSALVIDEIGYQRLPTPGVKSTWVRFTGIHNFSEYSAYDSARKKRPTGLYALGDRQLLQPYAHAPRRGLYVGASFMYASPTIFAYDRYLEARIYGIGIIPSRPRDLISFVVNDTFVSVGDRRQLVAKKERARSQLAGVTLAYTFNLAPGVFLNAGLSYDVHPTIIYDDAQGNPLLLRGILVIDL